MSSAIGDVVDALFGTVGNNSDTRGSGESAAGSGDAACVDEGTPLIVHVETMLIIAIGFAGFIVALATVHIWLRCLRDCGRRPTACPYRCCVGEWYSNAPAAPAAAPAAPAAPSCCDIKLTDWLSPNVDETEMSYCRSFGVHVLALMRPTKWGVETNAAWRAPTTLRSSLRYALLGWLRKTCLPIHDPDKPDAVWEDETCGRRTRVAQELPLFMLANIDGKSFSRFLAYSALEIVLNLTGDLNAYLEGDLEFSNDPGHHVMNLMFGLTAANMVLWLVFVAYKRCFLGAALERSLTFEASLNALKPRALVAGAGAWFVADAGTAQLGSPSPRGPSPRGNFCNYTARQESAAATTATAAVVYSPGGGTTTFATEDGVEVRYVEIDGERVERYVKQGNGVSSSLVRYVRASNGEWVEQVQQEKKERAKMRLARAKAHAKATLRHDARVRFWAFFASQSIRLRDLLQHVTETFVWISLVISAMQIVISATASASQATGAAAGWERNPAIGTAAAILTNAFEVSILLVLKLHELYDWPGKKKRYRDAKTLWV